MVAAKEFRSRAVQWKTLLGASFGASVPDSEQSLTSEASSPLRDVEPVVCVRDPDIFVAGEIHKHQEAWENISKDLPNRNEIMNWINNKVSVREYLHHFKGQYGGISYDSDTPVPRLFQNHPSCKPFAEFISRTILDRIEVGAIGVIGKVGECPPPTIVMPLTVEPSKPRLCQDQRYLNCWMKDMPFRLDSAMI